MIEALQSGVTARTGQRGAGMIFVSTLEGATKVRTSESGEAVL
jgi:nitrogen regulatory protein PII